MRLLNFCLDLMLYCELQHENSNIVVCMTSKASDQPAHRRSLIRFEYSMSVELLTEHHWDLLSIKGICTGSSISSLVKMPYRWKSRVAAQLL